MAADIIIADIPPLRNKWTTDKNWQTDKTLREIAKSKNEFFYIPAYPCKNGHFKRYVNNNSCIECKAIIKKNIRMANPIHAKAQKTKHHLKSVYGISVEEYEALLKKQNSLCAICGNTEIAKLRGKIKKLSVDHCHKSKAVRGLLCSKCNMGIGNLNHNSELLRKAALYCEET